MYRWGKSKSRNKAAAEKSKKSNKAIDRHIAEIQPFVPLSRNEQLMRYLQRTYEFGCIDLKLNDPSVQKDLLDRAPAVRMKGGFNPFQILLEIQSPAAPSKKQRQRHARALWAAQRENVPPSAFRQFVKDRGGINKLGDSAIKAVASTKFGKVRARARGRLEKSYRWGENKRSARSKTTQVDWV